MKILTSITIKDLFHEFIFTKKVSFEELQWKLLNMGYHVAGIKFPPTDNRAGNTVLVVEHGQTNKHYKLEIQNENKKD